MARLDDRFLDCSVYLYPTEADAKAGERIGGSGFLCAVPGFGHNWFLDPPCPWKGRYHGYVVSNRHVVEKNPVVRLNTHDGRIEVFAFGTADWRFASEQDLAVVSIPYSTVCKFMFISSEKFLTKDVAAKYDVGIGDEVFMVGRFISHDGRQTNEPTVRFGHVSKMPNSPVYHPSNSGNEQESFLVEIRSISGFSGSPVFVRPLYTEKLEFVDRGGGESNSAVPHWTGANRGMIAGPWLLGVEWGYINKHDQEDNNSGMSGVVPAWRLFELLHTPFFIAQRRDEQQAQFDREKKPIGLGTS